jgi:hypothetical protein
VVDYRSERPEVLGPEDSHMPRTAPLHTKLRQVIHLPRDLSIWVDTSDMVSAIDDVLDGGIG